MSVAQVRIPPHSIEAEQAVLCGLLLNNESWDRLEKPLQREDFFRYEHQLVFGAIESLIAASKPADVITVYEQLQCAGKGEEVGGLPYLSSIAQASPSSANIARYAEIVRERATLRRLSTVAAEIDTLAFDTSGRTVQDRLAEAEAQVMAIAEGGRPNESPDMNNLVTQFLDMVSERADNPSSVTGTPTGYVDLDRITCGLQPGDLVILAARPSMGKTAMALNIAENVALKERLPVAVFSMEMGSLQLVQRLIGSIGRIDLSHIRSGRLTDDEWPRLTEAVERMRDIPLEIDETPGLTVADIRSKARRWKRKFGKLGLIVVDYLQLMSVSSAMSSENRATAVGELSRGMKMLAKEMGCPVMALSQLSRAVEARTDKRPMMSDLRESGAIEMDADVILFLYRDDYYTQDSKEPGVTEVIISKQRNGPTGTVKMAFIKELTRFENLAHSYD